MSIIRRYKDLAAGIASSDIANLSTAHKAAVTSVPAVCDSQSMSHKKLPDAATAADKIVTVLGKQLLSGIFTLTDHSSTTVLTKTLVQTVMVH